MTAAPFVPAHRIIESEGASAFAFVLHGALGSGQNFNRFIQRLASERGEYNYVLVDLRHHGRSRGAPPPDTLRACAEDLSALGAALGHAPRVVLGHSFGGKVAVEYARLEEPALAQVWILDAVLGTQEDAGASEVSKVLAAVRSVPMPAESRRAVVSHLTDQARLSPGLAEWMTTNLVRSGERYEWTFNLDAIEALMADYFRVDLWDYVSQPRERPEFRLVVAERSDRWTPELRKRARELPAECKVRYHELENAGHWLHVDNPEGLLALLAQHLIAA